MAGSASNRRNARTSLGEGAAVVGAAENVAAHHPHGGLLFEVVGGRHVGHQEFGQCVAVEVGEFRAHGEP